MYGEPDETGGGEINEAVSKVTFADKSSFFEQQISILLELVQTGKQLELFTGIRNVSLATLLVECHVNHSLENNLFSFSSVPLAFACKTEQNVRTCSKTCKCDCIYNPYKSICFDSKLASRFLAFRIRHQPL